MISIIMKFCMAWFEDALLQQSKLWVFSSCAIRHTLPLCYGYAFAGDVRECLNNV